MFVRSYICIRAVDTVGASEYFGLICTEQSRVEACSLQQGGTSAPEDLLFEQALFDFLLG